MKSKMIAALIAMTLSLGAAGCSAKNTTSATGAQILSSIAVSAGDVETVGTAGTFIELGDTVQVNGTGATVENKKVTITAAGTYSISGTVTDGQIIVAAGENDKVYIILNGVNISSSSSSPVYVKSCDKAVVSMAAGTNNYIKDTSAAAEAEPDAAIFSKDDLIITGTGSLSLESANNDGIAGNDDLKIQNGNISITAAGDGIKGKDTVVITDGNIVVNSKEDGIKATNDTDVEKGYVLITGGKLNVTAGEDGIQGEVNTFVKSGDITIKSGGGSANSSTKENWGQWGPQKQDSATSTDTEEDTASAKAIKAGVNIVIEGGTFNIDSSDDAFHSNNNLVISNGTFNISSGDDGLHSDSTLTINKGTINIAKAYEGIESQTITINDGTVNLTSSDDGLNASGGADSSSTSGRQGQNSFASSDSGMINLNGGNITVNAEGDGIDSNGSIKMTGGNVTVNGPVSNGNGALDYNGTFDLTGGILTAAGSSGMAQAPSTSSTQNSVKINLTQQAANTPVYITDSSGSVIVTVTPAKDYASVVISSPKLVKGSTYNVYVGENKKTLAGSFTVSGSVSEVTQAGASASNGGGPGSHGTRKAPTQ